ncbi:HAD-IB family phosphatase [Azorhizobium doebereinerae]|uniref:HAD-IB family phosphatase n=1 Tax=Azorhizobium doebereinerae TaxID=281091 RepID=UPI0003FF9370|nr:HAD-IB family phosphatase [Azorhizobium doebereinerae]
MRLHFALDFDGTICPIDTTDFLLETFADPAWLDIEARWQAGEINSRDCLAGQVALIRARPEEIDAALAGIALDPAFADFLQAARAIGAHVSVVSDGFDRSIRTLLAAAGIDLPVACNRLVQAGADRWRAEFGAEDATCSNGTCKCAAVQPKDGLAPPRVILVGDGRSDFCLARRADFVLAKGRLATFCAAEGIAHRPISGFADARAYLTTLHPAQGLSPAGSAGLVLEDLHA